VTYDIIIIGGGIVGLATGMRLLEARPALKLLLLEKEPGLARHQTGNNSGVLHSGLYYRPGSEKARLSVEGLRQMVAFCRDHGIPYEQCGKIVVATSDDELPRLENLWQRGLANGLQGLRRLAPEQIREIEPHAAGIAAIHVPQEGIVDYRGVSEKLGELIQKAEGEIRLGARVLKLRPSAGSWIVETTSGEFHGRYVVTCAGLHSDRMVRAAGGKPSARIVPFRGEYYKIRKDRQYLVRHLIYPVPDPKFPFLGVHFTRLIHGGIEAGPNAVLAFARRVIAGPASTSGTSPRQSSIPACGGSSPRIPACAGTRSAGRSRKRSSPARCRNWCRRSARMTSSREAPACALRP